MIKPDIPVMQLVHWKHVGNEHIYEVMGEVLVKDADSGVWEEHIMYRRIGGTVQQLYARSINNFLERFTQVNK